MLGQTFEEVKTTYLIRIKLRTVCTYVVQYVRL